MTKNLRLLTTVIVACCFIFGTALFSRQTLTANNSGAPSARTGSPGDMSKNCTTCHTGTAQNAPGIISSNVPPAGYVPGNTYIISALVTDASRNRFGFEISPQNAAGNKLGVITITDFTRTKLIGSGKYITHTAAGTSGTGSNSWSFNWTAPPTGTGDVTFYGAFNFSNHNNASSGDVIKLDQLTIHEDLTTSIFPPGFEQQQLGIFPNPVSTIATVELPENVKSIQVYDVSGALVRLFENFQTTDRFEMDVTTFRSGTYYVSFATGEKTFTTKLIKL